MLCKRGRDLLLWIVCRIRENTGEEPSSDAITTLDEDPILVSLHELLVEQEPPNPTRQFCLAETKGFRSGSLAGLFPVGILERVW